MGKYNGGLKWVCSVNGCGEEAHYMEGTRDKKIFYCPRHWDEKMGYTKGKDENK